MDIISGLIQHVHDFEHTTFLKYIDHTVQNNLKHNRILLSAEIIGLAYGTRTHARLLSMTIWDDPLPYAFQQLELPQLRSISTFQCFWNPMSATGIRFTALFPSELMPEIKISVIIQAKTLLLYYWQGWLDLNQRMWESKSHALPLGNIPVVVTPAGIEPAIPP